MGTPFLGELKIISWNLRPQGVGIRERAVPADQPEPGALLAVRHALRRQRPDHLRAARHARQDAASMWEPASPSARRQANPPHAHHRGDARAHPPGQRLDQCREHQRPGRERARHRRPQQSLRPGPEPRRDGRRPPSPMSAAARRTRTCSRTSRSIHHRPSGRFPVAELRELSHEQSIYRGNPDVRRQFRARRLGVLQRRSSCRFRKTKRSSP